LLVVVLLLLLLLGPKIGVGGSPLIIHAYLLPRHHPSRLWRGIPLGAAGRDHNLPCLLSNHSLMLLIHEVSHVAHELEVLIASRGCRRLRLTIQGTRIHGSPLLHGRRRPRNVLGRRPADCELSLLLGLCHPRLLILTKPSQGLVAVVHEDRVHPLRLVPLEGRRIHPCLQLRSQPVLIFGRYLVHQLLGQVLDHGGLRLANRLRAILGPVGHVLRWLRLLHRHLEGLLILSQVRGHSLVRHPNPHGLGWLAWDRRGLHRVL
jgi:hypothetical protein